MAVPTCWRVRAALLTLVLGAPLHDAVLGASANVLPTGGQLRALHDAYGDVFRSGNRNAAAHLWVSHVLDKSPDATEDHTEATLAGFCAVSGSPVRPSPYNRYGLTLPRAGDGVLVYGHMHYCCWPCVCDIQDFALVDSAVVDTAEGPRNMTFAVIGDP